MISVPMKFITSGSKVPQLLPPVVISPKTMKSIYPSVTTGSTTFLQSSSKLSLTAFYPKNGVGIF